MISPCRAKVPSSDRQESLQVAIPAKESDILHSCFPNCNILVTLYCSFEGYFLLFKTFFSNSLVLQGVELTVKLHIIPLIGGQFAVLDGGEGVQEMGTKAWVDVIGHVNGWRWSVLRPVCEVA